MESLRYRRSPVDLPGPEGDNTIAREPLWYAFGSGDDRPDPPSWTYTEEPPPDAHVGPPPVAVRDGSAEPLPRGTADLLARAPYPHGSVAGEPADDAPAQGEALRRALVACFSPVRREPENPYNDHRGYPSPRCLFPVHAFLSGKDGWRMLDPDRHALLALPGADGAADGGAREESDGGTVVLTGRYTCIPRAYKWFRGSLVTLELGIVLRSLCIGLELFGLSGHLRLPGGGQAQETPAGLGLTPEWEWSLPLVLDVAPQGVDPVAGPVYAPTAGRSDSATMKPLSDPALTDLVRVNRAQDFTGAPHPLGTAVPADASPAAGNGTWAEVLWQRSSGRMPRGLHGMSGRRRDDLPAESMRDVVRWLSVPPPGEELRAVYEAVRATVVLQGVTDHVDGVYHLRDGDVELRRADTTAASLLEQHYGYGLTPGSGCDIRHASMVCFLSVRPRELFDRFGPGGWSAAQYACGWATQGVCLSAAASGLFARPVRAFTEVPSQQVLELDPDEMLVLAVVVGTQRHEAGLQLDLRV